MNLYTDSPEDAFKYVDAQLTAQGVLKRMHEYHFSQWVSQQTTTVVEELERRADGASPDQFERDSPGYHYVSAKHAEARAESLRAMREKIEAEIEEWKKAERERELASQREYREKYHIVLPSFFFNQES